MSPVAMLKNWCDYTVETRYKTLISKEKENAAPQARHINYAVHERLLHAFTEGGSKGGSSSSAVWRGNQ